MKDYTVLLLCPDHEVAIDGPCRIVYSPDKPLRCGAKVWIETRSPVATTVREMQ